MWEAEQKYMKQNNVYFDEIALFIFTLKDFVAYEYCFPIYKKIIFGESI